MRRRAFLAGVAGLAGCGELRGRRRSTETVTPAPVPTTALASDAERFADVPCPTFNDRTQRTVCWHDSSDPDLVLRPHRTVVALSGSAVADPVRFTLRRPRNGPVSVFAGAWALYRLTDRREHALVAAGTGSGPTDLRPAESISWVLTGPDDDRRRAGRPIRTWLTPGVYALVVEAVESEPNLWIECVALFEAVDVAERAGPLPRGTDG